MVKRKRKKILGCFIALFLLTALIMIDCKSMGKAPWGERLERIEKSPNYSEGQFRNQVPASPPLTPAAENGKKRSRIGGILGFVFRSKKGQKPKEPLPSVKTDLKALNPAVDMLVWMGHSSLYLQSDGRHLLIDPVLVRASPVAGFNKPFKGADVYKSDDIPVIDYLFISHDHYDHLDYNTLKKIKERTGKIICGLGVGSHLEYWGFGPDSFIELDWYESADLGNGFTVYCFPARHFSGRGLKDRNKTLWVSYIIKTPTRVIYYSGDGGYDGHFTEVAERFPEIDLAIMENGQYNLLWADHHMLPENLVRAVRDLHPKTLLTVHNSKYTLSTHTWQEPLEKIAAASEAEGFNLVTPMIGETVYLSWGRQTFSKWWEGRE